MKYLLFYTFVINDVNDMPDNYYSNDYIVNHYHLCQRRGVKIKYKYYKAQGHLARKSLGRKIFKLDSWLSLTN